MGGGVAMGDFDGDGFLDLFFTGSAANGKKPEAGPCGVLYRNRGDGTFEDVTARSGIRSCGWKMGASWVDLDGEGRLDLVVTGVGKTELWKNLGDGTFREVAAERGLAAPGYAVGLAAGDVERGRARRPLRRRLSRHGLREGERRSAQFERPHAGGLRGPGGEAERAGRGRPLRRAREGGRRPQHGRARPVGASSSTTTATASPTSTSRTTGRRTSSTATGATARSRT